MSVDPIKKIRPLTLPWLGLDPFLFCMYHHDDYPAGNSNFGPKAKLNGRNLGQDFANVDGWNMYHGEKIPGFPQHPHRGFETVTLAREGLVDHADSLNAAARFGNGDTQWITAGKGISHSEMFPLLNEDQPNPLDLFQIWLNLPKKSKRVDPYFSIFWSEQTPRHKIENQVEVTLIAGALGDLTPPPPPPHSYASHPESDLAIWTIKLAPNAEWTIPKSRATSNRMIYIFKGGSITVGETATTARHSIELRADVETRLQNGNEETEILMLQAKPIGEPVAQHGPFVMNTEAEIQEAFGEYRRTLFGGWPWADDAPVHGKDATRFARYPDGRVEKRS
jgi:redox-sensitive bicupin YhaK (pirin superfamily)